ncbi:MAG: DUF1559 domain-containing protein [Thermoguttaceae bacterium]
MVATSLALFAPVGQWAFAIWADWVILVTAFCLYSIKNSSVRFACVFFLIFFGIICPGLWIPIREVQQASPRAVCMNNLKQIGLALRDYHDANKHFPTVNTCDKDGKPLFSWRVEMLPMIDYEDLYNSFKKDEPWNSPHNAKILGQVQVTHYKCLSDKQNEKNFTTNYIAIIGPGTTWRKDGPVKISDLPDGGSHTVMVVETVDSGVHWAEPRDLTVEEALERMKTGKGLRISTAHPSVVNVLFADGAVQGLPAKMPISLWRKLLAGEVKDINSIYDENIDESAPDMVDVHVDPLDNAPGKWLAILAIIVWMTSVMLLFDHAIKSRKKLATAT